MSTDAGTLWIVATPIGSREDLSPRARRLLSEVDLILAEDTRRSRRLLQALEIPAGARFLSLHEHNEKFRVEGILESLRDGMSAALLSDAGTPVLSDPGFLLVRAVREAGLPVASLPGPSAFVTALAAAGLPPLPATLVGFLPPRSSARRTKLEAFRDLPWTLVFFLSPHRLEAEIRDVADVLGSERPACLLAELSKLHERAEYATLEILRRGREAAGPRGEYVLVVGPQQQIPDAEAPDASTLKQAYEEELNSGHERREARRRVAKKFGVSRREVYSALLEDRKE